MYHYDDLKEIYTKSTSITGNKTIQFPKTKKTVSDKNRVKKFIWERG